jgi:hypothetical protein
MAQLIIMLIFLGLAILAMAVRMIFIKNGEMRTGCAGKNPLLNDDGEACGFCGAMPGDECQDDEGSLEASSKS